MIPNKTRKQVIFEFQKRNYENRGEKFPYASYEEMEADHPSRHQEWRAYVNQQHVWLEDDLQDQVFYNFHDPSSGFDYTVHLHHGSCAEFWSVELTHRDGDEECGQWINSVLHGCYEYDDLPYLKIDVIRFLEVRFPAVKGWNDEFLKHGDS